LFLWLFRRTESAGTDDLNAAVSVLFRMDPLVAASAVLAGKQILTVLWPALAVVALTLLLGRFVCGWICPLGTLLDLAHRVLPRRKFGSDGRWRSLKSFLLVVVLVSALLNLQLIGYVNPFSILVRGLTVAVDPMLTRAVSAPFTWMLWHAPEPITRLSEPVYAWLKAHVLPFSQTAFVWSWISLALLLAVFGLELIERRFWCRNVCPSGALLAILARFSYLRRLPGRVCTNCKAEADCGALCRMGAFDREGRFSGESCNLCMDCVERCLVSAARFRFRRRRVAGAHAPAGPVASFEPSRRMFLASVATGVAVPVATRGLGLAHRLPTDIIRPPGVLDDDAFLGLCVRCGECMKVCTTNALQPVLFETGVGGAFAPRLIARMGYCEYNCTLCGQVCPTGAIPRLPLADKQKQVIGKAVFDKDVCLPYAQGETCITCEEHCPLPEKAIRFREVEVVRSNGERAVVQQPFTVLRLCIGCGICVNKCPVAGAPGVHLVRTDTVPEAVRLEYEGLEAATPGHS